jgi:glutathione synthase/RimK-type ligase-like ATP-grasp enzyme
MIEEKKSKIAILICKKYYGASTSIDNNLFLSALEENGFEYDLVVWDQYGIFWKNYTAVLIRATWDYIEGKRTKFLKILNDITKHNIPIFNSIETIQWNSKKNYLLYLQQKNINIIETLITSQNKLHEITHFLLQRQSNEYVVKPVISGGAYKTYRATHANIQQILGKHFEKNEELIIQPFISEIIKEGEWSLIFFDNVFSHAVLLKPAAGDFRVQIMHGGTVIPVQPPAHMIQEAKRILSMIEGGMPLYARVDFVRKEGKIYLMEIELIEPSLFFRWNSKAAYHFVNAISKRLTHLVVG